MPDNVQEVLQAFARGELVVVTDDEDREGEGDLIVAASLCTAEKMAFIIRHTSGIVCAPVTTEDARRLRLDPMVAHNDSAHTTAFTVSIDYKPDGGTGISAEERASCCRALSNPNAGANDFARPGHIFPLIAKDGGVLMRSGHTEACIDLCRLAGLPAVGVLSELMNDDGTVMRGADVAAFAEKHKLKRISIADLIAYRQAREKLVDRISEFTVPTEIGPLQGYAYMTHFDQVHHMALVYGRIDGTNVPTRLHRANLIRDMFGGTNTVAKVLRHFKREGQGVIVFLRDGSVGVPVSAIPKGGDKNGDSDAERQRQWREIGLGAQILKDLGISSIRLLTAAKHRYVGLAGFGIEIVSTEPIAE
jgi:3,4-dihydroxy 2-butanone 4-phosphate synthase/GTP cyclohydrolase II